MHKKFDFEKKLKFSATNAMSNFILTSSETLKENEDYKKIVGILSPLIESGLPFVGKGYCITMSDVVSSFLIQNGVNCKLTECQLVINNKNDKQQYIVGFDDIKDDNNREDTHVVIITETDVPMLIDMSIAHMLPNNLQCVIDEVKLHENVSFCNSSNQSVDLTYKEKTKYSIPLLYQSSIVDRMKTDAVLFDKIKNLKIAIIIVLCISSINAARGFYDFYQVFINQNNNWGPSAIEKIMHRLDALEQKNNK